MRAIRLSLVLLLVCSALAFAAPQFPPLTGRVVDEAHILSASTVQSLDQMLAEYERGTTNQVVVVTIPSLQGNSIEDYGYQLGRTWQIGQKGENNGALLIIAPKDRKVRIEAGYGLEPVLTDAVSSKIITGIIIPAFRSGNMEQGIVDGTRAMLSVLGGKGVSAPASSAGGSGLQALLGVVLLLLFFWFAIRHPFIAAMLLSSHSARFGGPRSGSGFRGGGGSFGGGGASGSW